MRAQAPDGWFDRLLGNSRFWILAIGVTLSVLIAGMTQLLVPAGSLQTIRIGQWFGFISLFLLYLAVLISPLTKVYPNLPGKAAYVHARRGIGVMAFYYALLHVYITFFQQLSGFRGIRYYNSQYDESLLLGVVAFGVLFLLAATSLDWAIRVMHFKNWKLLHRLVYVACVAVLLHVMILGPHFTNQSLLGIVTYAAAGFLAILEGLRIQIGLAARKRGGR